MGMTRGRATRPFATIPEAVEEIGAGRMVVVLDDVEREDEGDLVMAAQLVTPEAVNFMARYGRGLVCVPLTADRLDALEIPMMVPVSEERAGTAFTISVDHRSTRTGISAYERAATIRALVDPATRPPDLRRPGHVFPLRYEPGGVLRRRGHTEAAVDLARLAGLPPAGVICEIMDDDGRMARLPRLVEFAQEHELKIITIAELVNYRRTLARLVERVAAATLPTAHGEFAVHAYEDLATGQTHLALVRGPVTPAEPVLVRVHSECLTGDALHSLRCDCGNQLGQALERIGEAGGVLLYVRQEGRGIGLANKVRAYALQEQGLDTVEANEALGFPPDPRDYEVCAQILLDLGVRKIRLLTNNPRKFAALNQYGLEIVERLPLVAPPTPHNQRYLRTKRDKLGHLFPI